MFGFFLLAIALVLVAAAVHGVATGAVAARYVGDVRRADTPKTFWLVVLFYFASAAYLGRLALFELLLSK